MPLGLCFPGPCKKCNEPKIQTEALWTEYLYKIQETTPSIGLSGLNWYSDTYLTLFQHRTRLIERFNLTYALREVGREDLNQWMTLLQNKFNEICDKYNHAYKLYDDEAISLDELGLGYVREYLSSSTGEGTASSASSATGDTKYRDTPTEAQSVINNPTTETLENNEVTGSSDSSHESSFEATEKVTRHDQHVMQEVNRLIEDYKQLDTSFTHEFDELFIGIMSEWC